MEAPQQPGQPAIAVIFLLISWIAGAHAWISDRAAAWISLHSVDEILNSATRFVSIAAGCLSIYYTIKSKRTTKKHR